MARRRTTKPESKHTRAEFAANQDLWDSRMLLAAIVDSSDDAIIGKDLDGIITSWNQGAERMYGYNKEEMLGKPLNLLAPPERRDEIPNILARIRRGERVEHLESVRITKDGRHLNVSITISPVRDSSGNIIGASAIARDLTPIDKARRALQESRSTTDALFQAAAQAILIVDRQGRIVMANPASEKMFGYTVDELVGHPVELLIPKALHGAHEAHRGRYFHHPQTRPMGVGLDLQARRKDGSEFYAEISLSHFASAQGTLAVAFISDISKRRADEQALRQQREDLRVLARRLMTAQDDERRRIARNLHDDLSQQLAHLAIDIGKLATKPAAAALLPALRPLQLHAAEAAETVRRISHELHPSILDDIGLEAAIEQYCEEFEERTGIAAEFTSRSVPEALPPEIASSIYHIAQEALRNVAKHAQTESVTVTLDSNGTVVRLVVKDNGIGLPTTNSQRNGIGIAAMQERANLINARFDIQSQPGSGTQVSVEVPLAAG